MENTNFDAEVKAAQREYFKAWRAANKDKVREHNQNYWRKKALQRLQSQPEHQPKEEKA